MSLMDQHIDITGYLGGDPRAMVDADGNSLLRDNRFGMSLSVAVNTERRDKDGNTAYKRVDWFDIAVYGESARKLYEQRLFRTGHKVRAFGPVRTKIREFILATGEIKRVRTFTIEPGTVGLQNLTPPDYVPSRNRHPDVDDFIDDEDKAAVEQTAEA